MKRLLPLALLLCVMASVAYASASMEIGWTEGELRFPDGEEWTYKYTYRYPDIRGEGPVAEALRHYFDLAFNEMTRLVLPMYAEDPIMTAGQRNEISEHYELTYRSDRLAGFLLTHRQTVDGVQVTSLRSVVFDIGGEYAGDTLTLRGVALVGDSSRQLGEGVLRDVWRRLQEQLRDKPAAFKEGLTEDKLAEVFYPESAFYPDESGRIVFYIQPGDLRTDDEPLLFAYTPRQLELLLEDPKQP